MTTMTKNQARAIIMAALLDTRDEMTKARDKAAAARAAWVEKIEKEREITAVVIKALRVLEQMPGSTFTVQDVVFPIIGSGVDIWTNSGKVHVTDKEVSLWISRAPKKIGLGVRKEKDLRIVNDASDFSEVLATITREARNKGLITIKPVVSVNPATLGQ